MNDTITDHQSPPHLPSHSDEKRLQQTLLSQILIDELLMFPRIHNDSLSGRKQQRRIILLLTLNDRCIAGGKVVDEIDVCLCFEEFLGFCTCR